MNDQNSRDPEERAFTGGADMPPKEPDQPAEENRELLRDGGKPKEGEDGELTDESFPTLPGYGG